MSIKSFNLLVISIILNIFIIITSSIFFHRPKYINTKPVISMPNTTQITFYSNIAVLVEFRTTDRIISVVHNVNYHIPTTWPIEIFHGKDNEAFIRNSTLKPLVESGKVLLSLMTEAYGKSRTNELLTDSKFWKRVRGEKILFFQIDSIMCSNSPHKVTDFLQYDYVGAPWDPSWYAYSKTNYVGNGGFSLRSRSKLLALLELMPYDKKVPEDVWYSLNLHRVNGSIPSTEIAKTFAVESIYYERPVGVHRFPFKCSIRDKLFETCPESILVMPAKCV